MTETTTGSRLRTRIYADERTKFPWRISKRLHTRVTTAAERESVATTVFVAAALRRAGKAGVDRAALAEYEDVAPGAERVTVTLRLPPSIYNEVRRAASRAKVSVNRYISYVVHSTLAK